MYVFCFVWSFGCNLDDNSRTKFNDFVSALLSPLIPDDVRGHDLFGFYVDKTTLSLTPWNNQMSKFVYDPKVRACHGHQGYVHVVFGLLIKWCLGVVHERLCICDD